MKKYNLREKVQGQHQTYTLGIKEVWEIDSSKHEPGHVLHTLGWPLDNKTYGGSFLYHMKDRQVSLGLVVALNHHNPFLNPYEEFQVFFIVIFAMFIYILYMDLPSHKSRLHIFFFICESLSLSLSFFIK
ncbi:hypothetical protein CsSME_00051589 [Camellia sinensis var. sinensis]